MKALCQKVSIASSHPEYRKHLLHLLQNNPGLKAWGEIHTAKKLLAHFQSRTAEVLLFDLDRPISVTEKELTMVRQLRPKLIIISVSEHLTGWTVNHSRSLGMDGMLARQFKANDLHKALNKVHRTGSAFPSASTLRRQDRREENLGRLRLTRKAEILNDMERLVLRLHCLDYSNQEISEALCISSRTVEGYRVRISKKLGTKTYQGAIAWGVKQQLI
ncbi:MAG: response regulator transcription factor [Bacteroidota bacterium]